MEYFESLHRIPMIHTHEIDEEKHSNHLADSYPMLALIRLRLPIIEIIFRFTRSTSYMHKTSDE